MADPIHSARQKIEAGLAELRAEEEVLKRALGHLGVPAPSNPAGPQSTKSSGRKRAKCGQREQEVIDDVLAHPGVRHRRLQLEPESTPDRSPGSTSASRSRDASSAGRTAGTPFAGDPMRSR